MKYDVPKLYRDNIVLTWLSDYKTAYQQSLLAKNFPYQLTSIKRQYDYKPFKLCDTVDELYDELFLEQMKIAESDSGKMKDLQEVEKEITDVLKDNESGD